MKPKIYSCPKCGAPADTAGVERLGSFDWKIICQFCQYSERGYDNFYKAIQGWNLLDRSEKYDLMRRVYEQELDIRDSKTHTIH